MNVPDTHDDRRGVDGEAGRGDMLGGLTTGAGGQLGLPDDLPADDDGVITIPTEPKQPTVDGAKVEPDTAQEDHSAGDPA